MDSLIVGADIGGSHITVAFVDTGSKQIVETSKKRELIDAQGTAADIINAWTAAFKASFAAMGQLPQKLGIAMPGPFDYQQGISLMKNQSKYEALYNLNIKEKLANALQLPPAQICFANDAACFLQGEVFAGSATGANAVMGLTLGTGLGSARAKSGIALDANLWCTPFKDGIAEDYLSTRWFIRRYHELTGQTMPHVAAIVHDKAATAICHQLFKEFGENLGTFLFPFLKKEKIDTVVISGSIAGSFHLFAPALNNYLQQQGLTVAVTQSRLGEDATLMGAVSFALQMEEPVMPVMRRAGI